MMMTMMMMMMMMVMVMVMATAYGQRRRWWRESEDGKEENRRGEWKSAKSSARCRESGDERGKNCYITARI